MGDIIIYEVSADKPTPITQGIYLRIEKNRIVPESITEFTSTQLPGDRKFNDISALFYIPPLLASSIEIFSFLDADDL